MSDIQDNEMMLECQDDTQMSDRQDNEMMLECQDDTQTAMMLL